MSQKRKADMAVIEAGLPANTLYIDGKPILGPDNKPLTSGDPEPDGVPSIAPKSVSNLTEPIPDDSKKEPEKQKTGKKELSEEEKQQQQLQLQQKQQSLLQAQIGRTIQASGRAINGFQNGVGSLSMPGGIGLPLAALIILLMLLIPVNGKTRFSWLWGVMTGNAALPSTVPTATNAASTNTSTGSGGTFSNGTSQGGGAPSFATSMFLPSGLYLGTGVEGVQL